MKKLTLGILASLFLFSCGGNKGGSEAGGTATIENETLHQELFGGVYIVAGYGDLSAASQVSSKPGDGDFLKDMESFYSQYYIFPFGPSDASGAKRMLSSAWGIKGKEDLISTGEQLLSEGHSKKYVEHLEFLKQNKDADLSALSIPASLDEDLLTYIKSDYAKYEGRTMKAWDYARYVNNINMGVGAGFLTKDEAKDLFAKMVPLAQADYDGWDAYFDDFLLGRELWNEGPDTEYAAAITKIKNKEDKYNVYNYVLFK